MICLPAIGQHSFIEPNMLDTNMAPATEMSEVSTPEGKSKNKDHVLQWQVELNEKLYKSHIINRILYVIVKRNDIIEFFGCLFLLLILYVIGCELNTYCLLGVKSIPWDASLYRYRWMIYFMIGSLGSLIVAIPLSVFVIAIQFAIKFICIITIKRYYIPGKQSYKWWQTKFCICLVVICIITLMHIVMITELGRVFLTDLNIEELHLDRLVFYRIHGIIYLIGCSIMSVPNITLLMIQLDEYLKSSKSICELVILQRYFS